MVLTPSEQHEWELQETIDAYAAENQALQERNMELHLELEYERTLAELKRLNRKRKKLEKKM